MIISLDTETTGLDRHHGARAFLVTVCDEQWQNTYWQFKVDPDTRKVIYDRQEVEEIIETIRAADAIVMHHAKFDVGMLLEVPDIKRCFKSWPWHKTQDTLISSHLIDSGGPHDLTTQVLRYLKTDMRPYDKRCEVVVHACRDYINQTDSDIGEWRIARRGLPEMPSAKESTWKYDLWLPAAILDHYGADNVPQFILNKVTLEDLEHAVPDYANSDSCSTLALSQAHDEVLEDRGHHHFYQNRLRLLPVIAEMENSGVTLNSHRLDKLCEDYKHESQLAADDCLAVANQYDYDLDLPRGGNNNSLREFVFDHLKLPPLKFSKKTGAPSLDSSSLAAYRVELPPDSPACKFVTRLSDKRKRDTALTYMQGYRRFWRPYRGSSEWRVLYPGLNPVGSHTLRFTSSNPNEQNISKKEGFNLRYNFGPPPGYEWWSLDAKNIELRLPAYESGEQELIGLFEAPDEPPYYGSNHLLNFSTVYPDIWEAELKLVGFDKVGPHCKDKYKSTWYQRCKNGGFAVQYGAVERADGELGTADKAFGVEGAHALLKERFSKLEALNLQCIEFAEEHGYIETMPDTTVDPDHGYPLSCKRDQWGRVKPTIPLNYHVQGSAMWWMMMAMINCQEQIRQWRRQGIYCRIVMQIHDELVFEFKRGPTKLSNLGHVKTLAGIMAQGGNNMGVPTPVGAELHTNNWSEGETLL